MEKSQKKRSNFKHQSQGKVESFLQASFPPVCPQWTACHGRRNPAGGTATPSTAECWRGRRTRWTRKTRRLGSSTRSCSAWPCPNRGACRRRERVRGAHTSARSVTRFPTLLKFRILNGTLTKPYLEIFGRFNFQNVFRNYFVQFGLWQTQWAFQESVCLSFDFYIFHVNMYIIFHAICNLCSPKVFFCDSTLIFMISAKQERGLALA